MPSPAKEVVVPKRVAAKAKPSSIRKQSPKRAVGVGSPSARKQTALAQEAQRSADSPLALEDLEALLVRVSAQLEAARASTSKTEVDSAIVDNPPRVALGQSVPATERSPSISGRLSSGADPPSRKLLSNRADSPSSTFCKLTAHEMVSNETIDIFSILRQTFAVCGNADAFRSALQSDDNGDALWGELLLEQRRAINKISRENAQLRLQLELSRRLRAPPAAASQDAGPERFRGDIAEMRLFVEAQADAIRALQAVRAPEESAEAAECWAGAEDALSRFHDSPANAPVIEACRAAVLNEDGPGNSGGIDWAQDLIHRFDSAAVVEALLFEGLRLRMLQSRRGVTDRACQPPDQHAGDLRLARLEALEALCQRKEQDLQELNTSVQSMSVGNEEVRVR